MLGRDENKRPLLCAYFLIHVQTIGNFSIRGLLPIPSRSGINWVQILRFSQDEMTGQSAKWLAPGPSTLVLMTGQTALPILCILFQLLLMTSLWGIDHILIPILQMRTGAQRAEGASPGGRAGVQTQVADSSGISCPFSLRAELGLELRSRLFPTFCSKHSWFLHKT